MLDLHLIPSCVLPRFSLFFIFWRIFFLLLQFQKYHFEFPRKFYELKLKFVDRLFQIT